MARVDLMRDQHDQARRHAAQGVRTVLRLDPLFPRGVAGCPDYQSRSDDLAALLEWAARVPVAFVITSPMKLASRRNEAVWLHDEVAPAFQVARGHYRRMLPDVERALVADLRGLGASVGLPVEHCFANILRRPAEAAPARASSAAPDPVSTLGFPTECR